MQSFQSDVSETSLEVETLEPQPTLDPSVRDIDAIFRETDRLYYGMARGCGLSDCAYWVLVSVCGSDGGITQSEIADEFSYSRQTVNSSVKVLLKRGLVCTHARRDDRRVKLVSLTNQGEEFCSRYVIPAVRAEERAFASLAPDERGEFVRIVRKYVDAIDAQLASLRATTLEHPGKENEATDESAND